MISPLRILAVVLIVSCSPGSSDANKHPNRLKGAKLKHLRGVLITYGMGNHQSTLSIIPKDGKRTIFVMMPPNLIDGKHYDCDVPPDDGVVDRSLYKEWPECLIIGKSEVDVAYWQQTIEGHQELVTDEISIVK
jgi:hypothetical protein